MKKWFDFRLQAEDPTVADIHVIDFIGDWSDDYWGLGVTAKSFVAELSKLPAAVRTIKVHVNSPGGDVFSALNIANALRDQRATKGRTVETIVEGLAASAASVVIMAGDPIRIADNGLVMIHNPWSMAVGDAAEMDKVRAVLDKLRDAIVATYRWRSALSEAELVALMDAETWMDADEAITNGFATEKVEGLRAAASIDPRAAAKLKVPERYAERVKALLEAPAAPPPARQDEPPKATADQVIEICAAAGLDIAFTQGLAKAGLTLEAAQQRVTTETASLAEAQTREMEIRELCRVAKLENLAPGYIASAMQVAVVRVHLTEVTALLDKAELDHGLGPDHGTHPKPVIDTMAIYAELNKPRTH